MKTITTSVIFTLLAAIAYTAPAPAPAPAPVPQSEPCNPNAHGRSCTAILYGAAGVNTTVNQEINLEVNPISKSFLSPLLQPLSFLPSSPAKGLSS